MCPYCKKRSLVAGLLPVVRLDSNENVRPRPIYRHPDEKTTPIVTNDCTFASNLRPSAVVLSCLTTVVEFTVDSKQCRAREGFVFDLSGYFFGGVGSLSRQFNLLTPYLPACLP